jgi:hypothetical protein
MQADYPANDGVRPCCVRAAERAEALSGRLFLCAGCRQQVIVCSCCDRGQVYCTGRCAKAARQQTVQQAGRRYQASHRGRRMHAARMSHWRARQQKVTHHGSPAPPASDLVLPAAMTATRAAVAPVDQARLPGPHCHWCGRSCLPLLRQGFLRRRRRHRGHLAHHPTGPTRHGDAA